MFAKADAYAEKAHTGQTRANGEPYIIHPRQVAALVATVPHTAEMLAAALLHDVVEDTQATIEDIEREFGPTVAVLVGQVTITSHLSDGNRQTRKALDRARLATASPEAKTIKLADIISNVSDSRYLLPASFARKYLAEKEQDLEVLTEGDTTLFAMAREKIGEAKLRMGLA